VRGDLKKRSHGLSARFDGGACEYGVAEWGVSLSTDGKIDNATFGLGTP
jgi:hypothetical protein